MPRNDDLRRIDSELTLIVDMFNITNACLNYCSHCLSKATKNGGHLKFSHIEPLLDSDRLLFGYEYNGRELQRGKKGTSTTLSVGDPLEYDSEGKNVGEVARLMHKKFSYFDESVFRCILKEFKNKTYTQLETYARLHSTYTHTTSILTAVIMPDDKFKRSVIGNLAEIKEMVQMTLSINLYRLRPKTGFGIEEYKRALEYTVELLAPFNPDFNVRFDNSNKDETFQLAGEITGKKIIDTLEASRSGNNEDEGIIARQITRAGWARCFSENRFDETGINRNNVQRAMGYERPYVDINGDYSITLANCDLHGPEGIFIGDVRTHSSEDVIQELQTFKEIMLRKLEEAGPAAKGRSNNIYYENLKEIRGEMQAAREKRGFVPSKNPILKV
ncbi:Uncharacterised protein [Candidatus Gugararchaeum adminiculabundum]|nr:Uncharacterised protein [Candidatus Gugararchaeum adminiculabundum]